VYVSEPPTATRNDSVTASPSGGAEIAVEKVGIETETARLGSPKRRDLAVGKSHHRLNQPDALFPAGRLSKDVQSVANLGVSEFAEVSIDLLQESIKLLGPGQRSIFRSRSRLFLVTSDQICCVMKGSFTGSSEAMR